MKLRFISQEHLRTGDAKIDTKIWFLISLVHGNFNALLDNTGKISCDKIDETLKKNTLQLPRNILQEIQQNLSEVREVLQDAFELRYQLSSANSFQDCKDILHNFPNRHISISTFNTILKKCDTVKECEEAISVYGSNLEFNIITYCNIFQTLVIDKNTPIYTVKSFLQIVLRQIENFWNHNSKTKAFLNGVLKPADREIRTFVYHTIEKENLHSLNFLITKKTQGKSNRFLWGGRKTKQEQEKNNFDQKLKEAQAAGLGSLAYLYASWQLSQEIWWWGKWHRKNGSTFGKGKKEM